jgi:hypothetical protein
MADPLCDFNLKEMTLMMQQLMSYNKKGIDFWSANSHIPQNQHARITLQILGPLVDNTINPNTWKPNWPVEFPIFSPYAITKGEHGPGQYSQIRFSGNGVKYYCHRAAYVHQHGRQSLGANQEISHTKFLGQRTSR